MNSLNLKFPVSRPGYILALIFCFTGLVFLCPTGQAVIIGDKDVLYETAFTTDPGWTTNSAASYYWDQAEGWYHYKIAPATGSYAYIDVNYDDSPFVLEYDVTPLKTDENAAFRFGFGSREMDFTRGTCVVSFFTNGKYGRILGLRTITQSNQMQEVTSQRFSYGGLDGRFPTVNYEDGQTYHVIVRYKPEENSVSMTVNNKATGSDVWSYFTTMGQQLHGLRRLYLTSVGDYASGTYFAEGHIDNVILYKPLQGVVSATPTLPVPSATPITKTPLQTTLQPSRLPTAVSATETPLPPASAVCALGIAAFLVSVLFLGKQD